jgi:hypothetical protein
MKPYTFALPEDALVAIVRMGSEQILQRLKKIMAEQETPA